MSTSLDALDQILEAHLAFVRDAARTPVRWPDVQRHYGLHVEAAPFGAVSATQVHAVVQAIVLGVAREVEKLGASDADCSVMWTRLGRLAIDEASAHADSIKPKTNNLGLGNIFANATAQVGKEWWAGMKYDEKIVALCRSCGAAQERTRDFKCAYCGGAMFGAPREGGGT
jgi:ribosomal protein L37E